MTASTPLDGDIELTGRIMPASNATFLGLMQDTEVVYKPIAGERPLWDFPDGSLAHREVAAFHVSETLGWNIVPPTWLAEGPHGLGMVQLWQHVDPSQDAVDIVPADQDLAPGWLHVFDGFGADEQPVSLIHEDSPALRRMAVFDAIANNADRKGGHVLEMSDGHRFGVDHGLTFHAEPKLRTVLWGWVDRPFDATEIEGIRCVRGHLDSVLGRLLADLITVEEVEALMARCDDLLREGRFPGPSAASSPIPWPPF